MKRFEYKTVDIKTIGTWKKVMDINDIDNTLNKLGQQGWELVSVLSSTTNGTMYGGYYTFKREL